MGDPSGLAGRDRNLIWRTFTGQSSRVRKTDVEVDDFETNAVADLRRAVGTYPDDPGLSQLVDDLLQTSPRFAWLWEQRIVTGAGSNSKTIIHPQVGPITLDCDVLTVAGSDLRLVVYTAESASRDAERLRLVQVIGLQQLGPRDRPTPGAVAAKSS
jgi:hypothetical protein